MARTANEGSVRQKAFARLDTLTANPDIGRKQASEILMKEFNIGSAYAMTLFQKHRDAKKASGDLTSVYRVRDTDNGVSIVSSHVLNPAKDDALTPEAAVKSYVATQQAKIDAAMKLDTKVPEPVVKPKVSKKTETSGPVASGEGSTESDATAELPWKVVDGEGNVVSEHATRDEARSVKAEGQKVTNKA